MPLSAVKVLGGSELGEIVTGAGVPATLEELEKEKVGNAVNV